MCKSHNGLAQSSLVQAGAKCAFNELCVSVCSVMWEGPRPWSSSGTVSPRQSQLRLCCSEESLCYVDRLPEGQSCPATIESGGGVSSMCQGQVRPQVDV